MEISLNECADDAKSLRYYALSLRIGSLTVIQKLNLELYFIRNSINS